MILKEHVNFIVVATPNSQHGGDHAAGAPPDIEKSLENVEKDEQNEEKDEGEEGC